MAKAKVVPKSTPVPFFPLLLHLSQTGNNLLSVIVLRQNLHLRFLTNLILGHHFYPQSPIFYFLNLLKKYYLYYLLHEAFLVDL